MGLWDNEEAHYVMIEPNLKYMLYSAQARANPPKAWYERPPPRPHKSLPVDKLRFLPCRRLQNAFDSTPWIQTVGDDLDSFTQLLLHVLIFRSVRGVDDFAAGLAGFYRPLGGEHAQRLQDWRDALENRLWMMSEGYVGAARGQSREARKAEMEAGRAGVCVEAVAGELHRVTKVNVRHQCEERRLAGRFGKGEEERAGRQYDEYLAAMGVFREALDRMYAREEEAKRRKAEEKTETEHALECKDADRADDAEGMVKEGAAEELLTDVEMHATEAHTNASPPAAGKAAREDETEERPSKKARVE
ncbi:hypothetical protein OH77DRAFT_1521053 [Trametes cingulata]|nr:hypothetical protein OH77DRAFT_1521053 [Trametes cingulata]